MGACRTHPEGIPNALGKIELAMARFDGKKITGLIGNMVFKNSADGKSTIIQRKAIGVKQTKGSKITSGIFAKASSLGKLFRIDFHSLMSGFYDRGMVNRLTKVNRDILEDCYDKANKTYVFEAGSFQRLEGFEFDSNSLLVNYFLKDVEVSVQAAELTVKIPAFETNKQCIPNAFIALIGKVICCMLYPS